MFSILRNEKGIAMLAVYLAAISLAIITSAAYGKSFAELHQVDREVARIRAFAAAEAGVQSGLAQIGANAYTGFINTSTISMSNFQAVDGKSVGTVSVSFDYPGQADWVIINATATVNGDTRTLEARAFLDSNLSKYLVYANSTSFASGTNAQYGEPDMTDSYGDGTPDYPEFVPANESDRAALYFTGDWSLTGSNVQTYGDANAKGRISGDSTSEVHGDTYSGGFNMNGSGTVTDDGIDGSLVVGDGFSDDTDRNGNGSITPADEPDKHKLSANGGGDQHKYETLTPINNTFYTNNNSTPQFVGAAAANRYLKFVPVSNGTATQIVEYTSSSFSTVKANYTLASTAIVYVKGNVYVKGEMGGRVSVVSSNSIYFDDNVTYPSGTHSAGATQSVAFLAKDKIYMRANDLTVTGILYGENASNSSVAFDADYNTSGQVDPASKSKLRLYGNRIMNGSTNLGNYDDRVYGYDPNLKYFRPPGIPVYPALRTVREK